MTKKITEIEGIGEATAEKLAVTGITTVEALLKQGSTKKGREVMANETGLPPKKILTFVNMADLFRIKGVGSQYAELMQAAGVNTVVELSKRRAENLHSKMILINEEKKLVRQPPSEKVVETWIEEAKELPRIVDY